MYCDIVFPNQNEDKFIDMAYRLGYNALVFVYEPSDLKKIQAANQAENKQIRIYSGMIASPKQLNSIKKPEADLVIVESSDSDREVLESKKADIIFNLENQKRQDFLHHRNSGLNQVLAKLALDNNVAVVFSFSNILQEKKRLPRLLGRIKQNIILARKFKFNTAIASFAKSPYHMRASHDMISFLTTLGMTPGDAKKSIELPAKLAEQNRKKKSKNYVAEGIELVE